MLKKSLAILTLVVTLFIGGCSFSFNKDSLVYRVKVLQDKINEVQEENKELEKTTSIIDFYNTLTTETLDSIVSVKSSASSEKYSNGIIIASSGFDIYVLVDYYAINQNTVRYTLTDAYANTYSAYLFSVHEETGLGILRCQWDYYGTSIQIGEETSIVAQVDSVSRINKVTLLENIKSSTITYNNATYKGYSMNELNIDNGTIFINDNNKLMGMYSSKLDVIVSEEILNFIIGF